MPEARLDSELARSSGQPMHTSVGATAVRRFQRPDCHQHTPAALQDENVLGIVPRRIDGRIHL